MILEIILTATTIFKDSGLLEGFQKHFYIVLKSGEYGNIYEQWTRHWQCRVIIIIIIIALLLLWNFPKVYSFSFFATTVKQITQRKVEMQINCYFTMVTLGKTEITINFFSQHEKS